MWEIVGKDGSLWNRWHSRVVAVAALAGRIRIAAGAFNRALKANQKQSKSNLARSHQYGLPPPPPPPPSCMM